MTTDRPLSELQRAAYRASVQESTRTQYHTGSVIRIDSDLDLEALQRAWSGIFQRHAAFRTTYHDIAGRAFQRVHDTLEAPIVVRDVRGMAAPELEALLESDHREPMDLARVSCAALGLYRVDEHAWLLLLRLHHLLGDLATADSAHDQLFAAYAAELAGTPESYAETAPSFLVLLDELERESTTPEHAAKVDAWHADLAGSSPFEWPIDQPRRLDHAVRGASETFVLLDGADRARLRAFAKEKKSNIFRVLLASWFGFLARISGQLDLVVGTPADVRPKGFEETLGSAINLLPLRVGIDPASSFDRLLGETTGALERALGRRTVPFAQIVKGHPALQDRSRPPVVQTTFSLNKLRRAPQLSGILMQKAPRDWRVALHGIPVRASGLKLPQQDEHFELGLWTAELDELLVGELKFDANLLSRERAQSLGRSFRTMLRSLLAAPDTALHELEVVDAEDRAAILAAGRGPRASVDPDVLAQVAALAHRDPAAVAIRWCDEELRRGELLDAARRFASHLRAAGAREGERVVLELARGPRIVIAMLGAWLAGAAFVPLDPGYPAERVDAMKRAARGAVLVTDGTWPDLAAHAPLAQVPPFDASRTAYVIFTSGSTGEPKGVEVTHRGLANLGVALGAQWDLGASSRLLSFASCSFDAFIADLVPALLSGALLHLGTPEALRGGRALTALLRSERITTVTLTPTVWSTLRADELPATLTHAITAGEACPPELARGIGRGRTLFDNYGPTEVTVCATTNRLGAGEIGIGRPIPDVDVYVVDDHGRLVPDGCTGEIRVGGIGVARGYLDAPGSTAAKFVADPFVPGSTVYRTGDRGRWRRSATGWSLEFCGRADAQVKVRGHRIELEEIEAALVACSGATGAAATVDTAGGRNALVGYVVDPAAEVDLAATKRALVGRLPSFKIPTRIVRVDALPLAPTGKVDRARLPTVAAEERVVLEARDELEAIVLESFRSVLPGRAFGVEERLDDLDADSLAAVEIDHRLSDRHGVQLGVDRILAAQSAAEIARVLREGDASELVLLREGDLDPALCTVHALAGSNRLYRGLLAALPPCRTLGLDPPLRREAIDSLAKLASVHADRLLAALPSGRLRLLGYSLGGVLAQAIAAELERRGHEVEAVLLLDAHVHVPDEVKASLEPGRVESWLAALLERHVPGPIASPLLSVRASASAPTVWASLARGRFEEVVIDSTHDRLLSEPALADVVRRWSRDA